MAEILSDFPDSEYEYEVKIKENNVITNRIDVLLTQNGKKYAVECQASSLSNEEVSERTVKLNRLGYPVLWVLSSKKFKNIDKARLLKEPESFIYAIYFGRIYYLNTETREIRPTHFERIKRITYWVQPPSSEGFYTDEPDDYEAYCDISSSTRYLKKKRVPIIGTKIKDFKLFEAESRSLATGKIYKIARFYDKFLHVSSE